LRSEKNQRQSDFPAAGTIRRRSGVSGGQWDYLPGAGKSHREKRRQGSKKNLAGYNVHIFGYNSKASFGNQFGGKPLGKEWGGKRWTLI
jgi:hypothetical protein